MKYQHLVGREWNHGNSDCYSLARDFYRDNFSLQLRNYARPTDWWRNPDFRLYQNLYFKEGFVAVQVHPTEWRPADAFLMAIKSKAANHVAIMINSDTILHHLYGRLSTTDKLGPWRNFIVGVVRHPEVPALSSGTDAPFMQVYRGRAHRLS
jgi:cell wall-associated NlpC family hydrolase